MGRIRTIKPEFPQSESMGRVSRDARLCFVMLWTIADDAGRLRGASRMLASLLFPYDDDAPALMESWLVELDREGCIRRYMIGGGSYIQIAKWLSHQKIDRPSASRFPEFDESSRVLAKGSDESQPDLGPRTKDQGPKTNTARKRAAAARLVSVSDLVAEGVEQQCAEDWLAARKAKTLPLTVTAWEQTKAEAAKAGLTICAAIRTAAGNGWAGFKASWLADCPQGRRAPESVTVASDAADKSAAYLAEQAEHARKAVAPPENIRALVRGIGRAA